MFSFQRAYTYYSRIITDRDGPPARVESGVFHHQQFQEVHQRASYRKKGMRAAGEAFWSLGSLSLVVLDPGLRASEPNPATGVHPGSPLLSTHNAEGRTGHTLHLRHWTAQQLRRKPRAPGTRGEAGSQAPGQPWRTRVLLPNRMTWGCHFCLTHRWFYLHPPLHMRPDHCK